MCGWNSPLSHARAGFHDGRGGKRANHILSFYYPVPVFSGVFIVLKVKIKM